MGEAQRKRILLVEDDEDNLSVYQTILEYVGYHVMIARDGERGVELAKQERPDLVLMDISLPRLDGWSATRILKADPVTRQIPIIALTAHALAEDRERSHEAGCISHLSKPIEPRKVVEEVRRILGGEQIS